MSRFYVICFDVRDERRLRRISDTLENFGVRVQRSVFECRLESQELEDLRQRLGDLMDAADDHVRYYSLCGKDCDKIVIDGTGEISGDPDYHLL